ncbi:MAG: TetR family transcriptional regulator C-terminal domain-containing protein [Halioglobus sp.]
MSKVSATKKPPRVQPKAVRRDQLIRATMKCIARNGLSGTTMAEVTREAGLSLGIANLHFESKDKLLTETLLHVSQEYNGGQLRILESDKYPSTADKIEALLQFDFCREVATKDKIAVWYAFWGEAKSRPTYQHIRRDMDVSAEKALSHLIQVAIDEAGYKNVDPLMLATGYTALSNGLWLNMLLASQHPKRSQARMVARNYLSSALPKHISTGEPV